MTDFEIPAELLEAERAAHPPPFEHVAFITIRGNDFAQAEWLGEKHWPVAFSYLMLHAVEQMPWKLMPIADEPELERKWFVREDSLQAFIDADLTAKLQAFDEKVLMGEAVW